MNEWSRVKGVTEWLGVVLILSGSRLVSSLRLVKAECYRISCRRPFVRGSYMPFYLVLSYHQGVKCKFILFGL